MHRTVQPDGRARTAVLRRHHLAAVIGHNRGPVVVVVAEAAAARQAVDRDRHAVETTVAVVAVAAAHIGVGYALHAALRVVAVGTRQVGVGHRGRATLVAALHAASHAPQVVIIKTTRLVARVGLARQLAERVVGIAPVAQVGVAHARLAAQCSACAQCPADGVRSGFSRSRRCSCAASGARRRRGGRPASAGRPRRS